MIALPKGLKNLFLFIVLSFMFGYMGIMYAHAVQEHDLYFITSQSHLSI